MTPFERGFVKAAVEAGSTTNVLSHFGGGGGSGGGSLLNGGSGGSPRYQIEANAPVKFPTLVHSQVPDFGYDFGKRMARRGENFFKFIERTPAQLADDIKNRTVTNTAADGNAMGPALPSWVKPYAEKSWQNFKDQPENQTLMAGLEKYKQYANTPLWRRATGFHNSRPQLTNEEQNVLTPVLNRGDVNGMVSQLISEHPARVINELPGDIANPISEGALLRSLGNMLRGGRQAVSPARAVLGTGMRGLGSGFLAGGAVLNSALEMPDLAQEVGRISGEQGIPIHRAIDQVLENNISNQAKVNSPMAYLQAYSNNIFNPIKTLASTASAASDATRWLNESAWQTLYNNRRFDHILRARELERQR